jgi:hypothetical protein
METIPGEVKDFKVRETPEGVPLNGRNLVPTHVEEEEGGLRYQLVSFQLGCQYKSVN